MPKSCCMALTSVQKSLQCAAAARNHGSDHAEIKCKNQAIHEAYYHIMSYAGQGLYLMS